MHHEPLQLREDESVTIGYCTDLYLLLRAIDETMPTDATLAIEGTDIAPMVQKFLLEREPAEKPKLAPNTLWPTPRVFHLPLGGTNLADLRALAEKLAEPEIGDHLVVYRDGEVLLWAHDAGDGYIRLSRTAPDGLVTALRLTLGGSLREREWPARTDP